MRGFDRLPGVMILELCRALGTEKFWTFTDWFLDHQRSRCVARRPCPAPCPSWPVARSCAPSPPKRGTASIGKLEMSRRAKSANSAIAKQKVSSWTAELQAANLRPTAYQKMSLSMRSTVTVTKAWVGHRSVPLRLEILRLYFFTSVRMHH